MRRVLGRLSAENGSMSGPLSRALSILFLGRSTNSSSDWSDHVVDGADESSGESSLLREEEGMQSQRRLRDVKVGRVRE